MPLPTTLELPTFNGPLDLLLDLIERRRLEITDVSLAAVADQYLQAVRALPEPDPDVLGEFLLIAARLLVLKSRALLPIEADRDDDEPLDDLAQRLEEYRRYKEVALELAARLEQGNQTFPHPPRPELSDLQAPLAPIEAAALARLWRSILARQQPTPRLEEPTRPRVQVGERLAFLRERIAAGGTLRWSDIAGGTLDELIATFLAVLELVRRSELRVRQAGCFGPIVLEASGGAPVAGNGQAAGHEAQELR